MAINAVGDSEFLEGLVDGAEKEKEEVSSCDARAFALLSCVAGGIGMDSFYAGNYSKAFGKFLINACGLGILIPVVVACSLFKISSGQYKDSEGRVIRQVVRLKKEEMSDCDQKTTFILSAVLGWFGVHQFYAGKPIKGILMLCTFGGLGIWNIMNVYQLATCGFKDGQGKTICPDYIKLAAKR